MRCKVIRDSLRHIVNIVGVLCIVNNHVKPSQQHKTQQRNAKTIATVNVPAINIKRRNKLRKRAKKKEKMLAIHK